MDRVEKFAQEIDELRAMRDELRVQMHLARADARDRWEDLEKSWSHLEGKVKVLRDASREERGKVARAARALLDEVKSGYEHLKSLL